MSAVAKDLLRQFEQAGIHLEPRGDKLHAEAKAGVLTPEMRAQLTANKPVLMHLLQTTIPASDSIRTRLLSIADAECIDPSLIRRLPDADLDACERLPIETLRAYIRALRASDLRERGKVPGDETAAALCRHCGPIWLHPAVVSVAPIVDGWARVLGCPWCHVRNRRAIPRPLVTCGECQHFERDAINPEGGMGRCMAGREPLPRESLPFPHAARQCAQFKPEGNP
jgi:hypothetical protein